MPVGTGLFGQSGIGQMNVTGIGVIAQLRAVDAFGPCQSTDALPGIPRTTLTIPVGIAYDCIILLWITLAMVLSMLPAMSLPVLADEISDSIADEPPTFSGGNGTASDPYQIATRDDLWPLSDYSNSGKDLTGLYFRQTEDIDLGGKEWIPVSTTYEGHQPPVYRHLLGRRQHGGQLL